MREVIPAVDVLSVTRIEDEGFPDESECLNVGGTCGGTLELLKNAKSDMIVMHPLPRVDEIDPVVDDLPNAAYFKETQCGVYLGVALLALIRGFRA